MIVLILVFGALVAVFLPMCIAILSIIVTVAYLLGPRPVHLRTLYSSTSSLQWGSPSASTTASSPSRYREERQADATRSRRSSPPAAPAARRSFSREAPSSWPCSACSSSRTPSFAASPSARSSSAWSRWPPPSPVRLWSLLGDEVNAPRRPIVGRATTPPKAALEDGRPAVVRRPATWLAARRCPDPARRGPAGARPPDRHLRSQLAARRHLRQGWAPRRSNGFGASTNDPAQVVYSGDIESDTVSAAITWFEDSAAMTCTSAPHNSRSPTMGQVALASILLLGDLIYTQACWGSTGGDDLIPRRSTETYTQVLVGGAPRRTSTTPMSSTTRPPDRC